MSEQSSKTSEVAKRYANALFDLALEADALEQVDKNLTRFGELLTQSPEMVRLIVSPVYSTDNQEQALNAVLDKVEIAGLARNFILLGVKNRRAYALEDMMQAFKTRLAQHRGEVLADVVSAQALNDKQTDELAQALKKSVGKEVTLRAKVDASLLGGIIVRVGSKMIDASLRTKLQGLKVKMKQAS